MNYNNKQIQFGKFKNIDFINLLDETKYINRLKNKKVKDCNIKNKKELYKLVELINDKKFKINKCSICFNNILIPNNKRYKKKYKRFIDYQILKCNHIIHKKCLYDLIHNNIFKCPICRNEFKYNEYYINLRYFNLDKDNLIKKKDFIKNNILSNIIDYYNYDTINLFINKKEYIKFENINNSFDLENFINNLDYDINILNYTKNRLKKLEFKKNKYIHYKILFDYIIDEIEKDIYNINNIFIVNFYLSILLYFLKNKNYPIIYDIKILDYIIKFSKYFNKFERKRKKKKKCKYPFIFEKEVLVLDYDNIFIIDKNHSEKKLL